ncbi:MAG: ABC transporter ATP-binding protein [Clostridiales bacterium]|nr:ABC transporter ATP-binding protein [Clostridiales bacterium]
MVKLQDICKSFGEIDILHRISLDIDKEEIVCILGPSGCGKSTLLNTIAGLINPDQGDIQTNIEKIGYVFQEDRLLSWKTVYENIRLVDHSKSAEVLNKLIEEIGLKGFENYFPNELSGGMRQRCSVARAFNYQAELLLMDEPFKSLDYFLRIKMLKQLINVWENEKSSICFVTHEIDEALLLGDRVIVLSNRPAEIVGSFKIETRQKDRKLNSETLVEIRSQIIDLLFESGNSI